MIRKFYWLVVLPLLLIYGLQSKQNWDFLVLQVFPPPHHFMNYKKVHRHEKCCTIQFAHTYLIPSAQNLLPSFDSFFLRFQNFLS